MKKLILLLFIPLVSFGQEISLFNSDGDAVAYIDTNNDDESYNKYSLKETLVSVNNFGMLSITGPAKDRQLSIKIFDKDWNELWKKLIKANDLKYN